MTAKKKSAKKKAKQTDDMAKAQAPAAASTPATDFEGYWRTETRRLAARFTDTEQTLAGVLDLVRIATSTARSSAASSKGRRSSAWQSTKSSTIPTGHHATSVERQRRSARPRGASSKWVRKEEAHELDHRSPRRP
jgi:hypothetical protein